MAVDDWTFDRNVVKYALVLSGCHSFPSERRFIFGEFVNGVLSFAGCRSGVVAYSGGDDFEGRLWDFYWKEIGKGSLDSRLSASFSRMFCCYRVTEGRRPFLHVDFYSHVAGICRNGNNSVFSIPADEHYFVEHDVLGVFSVREKECLEGIGRAMRPFVEKDLEFIAKNYVGGTPIVCAKK